MSKSEPFPKLIVFDLDNTIWTPELYQLRRKMTGKSSPIAKKDIQLFPGATLILSAIRNKEFHPETRFALASRTQSVDWAHDLLNQFGIRDLMDFVEIFPGSKLTHFKNLKHASGLAYKDMLFFDDARDGKYGNCEPISQLGVLSVHCPQGLETYDFFEMALMRYAEWDGEPGTIIEWDGSVAKPSTTRKEEGIVKAINYEKRYGFIQYHSGQRDVFFHFNSLPEGVAVETGTKLSFITKTDPRNGKKYADSIQVLSAEDSKEQVSLHAFSMNQPFAALLANGYKTLETRNGTMFVPYPEGTQMLLHVGRRTYPDGDKHIAVMESGGLSKEEIEKLKSLPRGYGRGMIVAVCELGRTFETTLDDRCDESFQCKVAAFGADSGKRATEIKRVAYLKRPLPVSGQGGVWKVNIDKDLLPDGWMASDESASLEGEETTPVYSVTL